MSLYYPKLRPSGFIWNKRDFEGSGNCLIFVFQLIPTDVVDVWTPLTILHGERDHCSYVISHGLLAIHEAKRLISGKQPFRGVANLGANIQREALPHQSSAQERCFNLVGDSPRQDGAVDSARTHILRAKEEFKMWNLTIRTLDALEKW